MVVNLFQIRLHKRYISTRAQRRDSGETCMFNIILEGLYTENLLECSPIGRERMSVFLVLQDFPQIHGRLHPFIGAARSSVVV